MYQILQEQRERAFREWIAEQNHKIEVMVAYGFDRDQAIELLKLQALGAIENELRGMD